MNKYKEINKRNLSTIIFSLKEQYKFTFKESCPNTTEFNDTLNILAKEVKAGKRLIWLDKDGQKSFNLF